jgi:hypothetical protein
MEFDVSRLRNSQSLGYILCRINPDHTPTHHFLKIRFNIIHVRLRLHITTFKSHLLL